MGVVGGGTAGWFAALAIKRAFPSLEVTVIASREIPIIGVGEATTPLLVPFLAVDLGIDAGALLEAVRPTWKLGIQFQWAARDFHYAFGDADLIGALAHEGDLRACSLTSRLMTADASPILRDGEGYASLLGELKFAWHLDNARLVPFLAAEGARAGVKQIDLVINSVDINDHGVTALVCGERRLSYDLYVDCSGFRSLLLDALGVPFHSYADSLWCDRAWVGEVGNGGHFRPYTVATTMDAGWCWSIAASDVTPHEDHRGYVYSSRFVDDETAADEMRRKNPGVGALRPVRFRSGRRAEMWRGNVVAVGNSYGFVEPLESTALHMAVLASFVARRAAAFLDGNDDLRERERVRLNARMGAHWDYLRWFLALHYRFNTRSQSPFWQAARAEVNVNGLDEVIERFRARGPLGLAGEPERDDDPVFGVRGLDVMLLGQGVPSPLPAPRIAVDEWQARALAQRQLVERALPQRSALALLGRDPSSLRTLLASEDGWPRLLRRAFLERMGLPST